jgi:hypothetical protein
VDHVSNYEDWEINKALPVRCKFTATLHIVLFFLHITYNDNNFNFENIIYDQIQTLGNMLSRGTFVLEIFYHQSRLFARSFFNSTMVDTRQVHPFIIWTRFSERYDPTLRNWGLLNIVLWVSFIHSAGCLGSASNKVRIMFNTAAINTKCGN